MKILFEKKFLKDIEAVNEKHVKQQVEIIILEMEVILITILMS